MKPEYENLIADIRRRYISKIGKANQNPNKWYELFVNEGEEEGTHTVCTAATFSEVVKEFEKYADLYGLDNINIDIWRPDTPEMELCPTELMYFLLWSHFSFSGQLPLLKMVGAATYSPNGDKPTFTQDYNGELPYFADEVAFRYFRNRVCYIPWQDDPEDVNDPDNHYARARLVEVCGGNEKRAVQLFEHLTGESPETLLEQWGATDGMFDDETERADNKNQ